MEDIVGKTFFHVTASDVVHVVLIKGVEMRGETDRGFFYTGMVAEVQRDGQTHTERWECDNHTLESYIASGHYQRIN